MRALIEKELAEHGWVLAVLIPFAILGHLFSLAVILLQQTSSPLESIRFFALTIVPILELILCNRLVVQEYSGKTQLFLESLPISRFGMLTTKFFFGLAIIWMAIAICFVMSVGMAWRSSTFDVRFLGLMTARWAVYGFATYSFFFMMGLMGRYRIALYVGVFAFWQIMTSTTSFDSGVLGPVALMNDQFAYEREIAPTQNLLLCVGFGLACCGIATALGLVREGSVAGMMAEKMSYREKIFIAGTLLTGLLGASVMDGKKRPEPYQMTNAVTQSGMGVEVQVQSLDGSSADESLASQVHGDLIGIAQKLDLVQRPEMFVAHRSDLDADRFEIGQLSNARGVLMRANYSDAQFDYDSMRPMLIDVWLSESTNYGAVHESRCWVLEGFSEFWPRQDQETKSKDALTTNELWRTDLAVDRRAAYAGAVGFDDIDIEHWYSYRERVGQPIIRSAACAGLVLAQKLYGKERLDAFLKAILSGDQPADVRGDIHRFLHPIDKVWRQTMGSDYAEFKLAWADELTRLGRDWTETLAPVPRLSATADWESVSGTSFRLQITPIVETSSSIDALEVQYQTLDVFDVWENDEENQVQAEIWSNGESIRLRRLLSRGERLRWTIAAESSVLDCQVISGWRRTEVGQ